MKKPIWSIAFICLAVLIPATAHAQHAKPKATVGAYYFDGWSGKTDEIHSPSCWKPSMPTGSRSGAGRTTRWRSCRSRSTTVPTTASPSGPSTGTTRRARPRRRRSNNALGLYLKAPNCQRLKFCLLVANHAGFRIGPKDWDACCDKWIELFQKPTPSAIGRPAAPDHLLARRIAKSLRRRRRGPQGIRLVAGQGEEGRTAGRVHRCLHRARESIWPIWPVRATRS